MRGGAGRGGLAAAGRGGTKLGQARSRGPRVRLDVTWPVQQHAPHPTFELALDVVCYFPCPRRRVVRMVLLPRQPRHQHAVDDVLCSGCLEPVGGWAGGRAVPSAPPSPLRRESSNAAMPKHIAAAPTPCVSVRAACGTRSLAGECWLKRVLRRIRHLPPACASRPLLCCAVCAARQHVAGSSAPTGPLLA